MNPPRELTFREAVQEVVKLMERDVKRCSGPTGDCADMVRDYVRLLRKALEKS